MFELLRFAAGHLLWPLFFWNGVFVMAAVLAGLPAAVWSARRVRRARAAGTAVSRTRAWLLSLWMIFILLVIPAGVAIVHAIPFAVERGLARALARSAPEAAEWITDLAASNVASVLGVAGDQTLLDVGKLQARVEAAALTTSSSSSSTFARIRDLTVRICLSGIRSALEQVGPGGRITWPDLIRRTKALMATSASAFVSDMVWTLHMAAWTNVLWTVGLVGVCNLLNVGVFLLAVHSPRAAGIPPPHP